MCQTIEITIGPDCVLKVFPTDCDDGGRTCRSLSAPFRALGTVVDDLDLGSSHVVSVNIDVKDVKALEKAGDRCGLVAVDTKQWDWYGSWQNDYSAEDAAYRNGVTPADYGKCEWALVQKDSPLGKAELAARAEGRRLTAAEVEEVRRKAHGGASWATNTDKPYSIGVIKDPEKQGFKLVYDFWAGGHGLRDKIGEHANKLKQGYGVEAAIGVARSLGHKVLGEHALADGSVKLRVQVPNKLKLG